MHASVRDDEKHCMFKSRKRNTRLIVVRDILLGTPAVGSKERSTMKIGVGVVEKVEKRVRKPEMSYSCVSREDPYVLVQTRTAYCYFREGEKCW